MLRFWKTALCAGLLLGLAACSGIPIRSMARLAKLPDQLLHASPAEILFAIQVDQRLLPAVGGTPTFQIDIQPAVAGAFEPVQRKLPMQLDVLAAPAMGLEPAGLGRRWMLYRFTPASQAELQRIQARFLRLQVEKRSGTGGSLAVGIGQDGVAAGDAALDNTRWESWLQTSAQQGFYPLWSGTLGELKAQECAARSAAATPKTGA